MNIERKLLIILSVITISYIAMVSVKARGEAELVPPPPRHWHELPRHRVHEFSRDMNSGIKHIFTRRDTRKLEHVKTSYYMNFQQDQYNGTIHSFSVYRIGSDTFMVIAKSDTGKVGYFIGSEFTIYETEQEG